MKLELLPDSRSQERFAELTSHVAARISLFSKSHDCGQEVAYLGPVRIPGGKGVFRAQSVLGLCRGWFPFLQARNFSAR
jgi:hypothetical protein